MSTFKYCKRSTFLEPCEKAISQGQFEIEFDESGGFSGRLFAIVSETDSESFHALKPDGSDWPKNCMPARINAAVKALHRFGRFGKFEISHNEGKLTIKPC